MLWRACDQPSTIVLPNCQEASQRQQLLLSRHLSPSSITLIKCSSSHSVIDKARQWLDQGPIKKKRSWPCTTWRYTGGHCASKSCNWERLSRPPLRKRVWLLIWLSLTCLCEKKGDFFQRKRMKCSKDTLIISGTSILMRACLDLPAIRYFSNDWVQTHQQFFENPSVKQNCNSCYRANCFFTKTEFQNITLLGTRALTDVSSKMFEKWWTCWNSRRQRGKDKHEKLPS